jgi:uncharacterized protein DUF5615
LRARGFDATTTVEASNSGATDEDQLAFASSRQMALLTHNRADFDALAAEYLRQGKSHYGIIISVRRPPHDILRRLLEILNTVAADEFRDQVRYI